MKGILENPGSEIIRRGTYAVKFYLEERSLFIGPGKFDIPAGGKIEYAVDEGAWNFRLLRAGDYKYKLAIVLQDSLAEADIGNNAVNGFLKVVEDK